MGAEPLRKNLKLKLPASDRNSMPAYKKRQLQPVLASYGSGTPNRFKMASSMHRRAVIKSSQSVASKCTVPTGTGAGAEAGAGTGGGPREDELPVVWGTDEGGICAACPSALMAVVVVVVGVATVVVSSSLLVVLLAPGASIAPNEEQSFDITSNLPHRTMSSKADSLKSNSFSHTGSTNPEGGLGMSSKNLARY